MRTLLLWCFLIPAFILRAQVPVFYSYQVTGDVFLKKGNSTTAVVRGTQLFAGDSLYIPDSTSSIILLSKDNYFVKLHVPGTYAAAKISNDTISGSTGISASFFNRMWLTWFAVPGAAAAQFRESGEVQRGGNRAVLVSPAAEEKISGDSARFEWNRVQGVVNNTLIIYNKQRVPVHQFVTKDTFLVVPTATLRDGNETVYFWKLRIMPDETMHRFILLSEEEAQQKVRELIA